jgi:hypothetical protein
MTTGTAQSDLPPSEVSSRLRAAMAGGNFEISSQSPDRIVFRHGTYLTQSAPLLPKRGTIFISPNESGSRIDYEIGVVGFAKYWMALFGIAFCWLIFPAVIVYRALFYHPDRLMKNLLQAI